MVKRTKTFFVLIFLVLVIGCSGCDGEKTLYLDKESIRDFLYNPTGWRAQEKYLMGENFVQTLKIVKLNNDTSVVTFSSQKGTYLGDGLLSTIEEDYSLVCEWGECALKISANASLEDITLTLTSEDGHKYYFSLGTSG
ncbi:MAG: hypothetical protein WC224_00675 [Sphaerochaetaceae bacterium]